MKVKVITWKDEKGFGFISPEDQSGQVFFHISSIKNATRKPVVGDAVVFEVAKDSQGRLRATHVLLVALLALSLGLFFKTGAVEPVFLPGAAFVIALIFTLRRTKQPANKLFSCAKCRVVAAHDERTVQAWNRGFTRLYCKACHLAWLREQPKEQEERVRYSSSNSGCLGLFLVLASVPVICIAGAVVWFV